MPEQDVSPVRAAMRSSRRAPPTHANDPDPAIGEARLVGGQAINPGQWLPDAWGLPPSCPVEPLGMQGDVLYVQDVLGQLQAIEPSSLGMKCIQMLFGFRQGYLYWAWPRHSKKGKIEGWRAEKVAEALYTAGTLRGVFDAANRVRGRGAWRDREGGLIYHSGSTLWRSSGAHFEEAHIGHLEGYFYPRRPEIPAPWPERVSQGANPCALLLPMLCRWAWERPEVDPILMLGWVAAAMVGGALAWRPCAFVIGDKATGKSTLQALVKGILGDALLSTADTTAAGIYQRVQQDSLPVAVDELEAELDQRKNLAVVKLARNASSGAMMLRGGADHVGSEFRAQSCFLFSSINPPPLMPQDVSRMAILRLHQLPASAYSQVAPTIVDGDTCGPRLLRRLIDGWSRFDRVLADYRAVLEGAGHDGRGQDTLGTLLACAHLAIGEELADHLKIPMVDELGKWGELLAPSTMLEYEDLSANWHSAIKYLLTSRVEAWRGGLRHTVGQLLEDLMTTYDKHPTAVLEGATVQGVMNLPDAVRLLSQAGLGIMRLCELDHHADPTNEWILCVPNESQLVAELYRSTPWAGLGGISSVWKSALRQAPAAIASSDRDRNRVRINGVRERCTLIRVKAFQDYGGD
jgi:hypothetical protein